MTEDTMTDDTDTTVTPVLYRTVTWSTGDRYYFGSIDDGAMWIELDRIPRQTDRDTIRSILDGWTDDDGRHVFPITCTARYFTMTPNGPVTWTATDPTVAPDTEDDG